MYDSRTKRGVPYAKVELLDASHRILETRYADRDGRYGFLAEVLNQQQHELQVSILPALTGYRFPSGLVAASSTDFLVYDNIYTGGVFTIVPEQLVNRNIPLDAIGESPRLTEYLPWLHIGGIFSHGLNVLFWAGVVAVPLAVILNPSALNFGVLAVFVVANAIRLLSGVFRTFGVVRDSTTGRPLAYALVTLADATGRRVTFSVSDTAGRYFLNVHAGTYTLSCATPANIVPQRTVTQLLTTETGWVTKGVRV